MDFSEMFRNLSENQGAIVSTASLEESSIQKAREENRLYVDSMGYGFVYLDHYHVLYSYDHGKGRPKYHGGSSGDL